MQLFRVVLPAILSGVAAASLAHATDAGIDGRAPGAAQGLLDDMVFAATLTVDQYDAPFEDMITFRDGMFYSEECQRACDFGWTPYYTRVEGDSIAFVVRTACSDSPQSVVWEGRVTDGEIEADVVWTVERFYWTVERTGRASGVLRADDSEEAAVVAE